MDKAYQDRSLVDLKLLAKERGLTGVSTMKKQDVIALLTAYDEKMKQEAEARRAETAPAHAAETNVRREERPVRRDEGTPRSNVTVRRVVPRNSRSEGERREGARSEGERREGARSEGDRREGNRSDSERREGSRPDNERRDGARAEAERREGPRSESGMTADLSHLDTGVTKVGILEIPPESGFGFIRCDNFLPGEDDVYVSPAQIRRFNMKTGDIICGNLKVKNAGEKYSALLYVKSINGRPPEEAVKRPRFEDLTPVFPHERIHLEVPGCGPAMRIVDLLSPIGKGQRGMIVSQPKAGKTTLLKQIAKAIIRNHPEMHMIILLIDERPEEVTDMKESISGPNVEVIYSTFDELPENHKRVSEMVIERAKRIVEHGKDVTILLDSITRLARAYNLTCQSSGRTLSGGLDPAALHMPKKFFGAARCMKEGGSLTILATALVETGSRMDDVVFEEFKGTGNMELVLDRSLSEKRIFPAIDLPKSSTRREDLLLEPWELEANTLMRRAFHGARSEEAIEQIIQMFARTRNNEEFAHIIKKTKLG